MAVFNANLLLSGLLGFVAGSVAVIPAVAQIPSGDFKRVVEMDAWTEDELKTLQKGDPVVRSLKTGEKQELANLGVVKIRDLPSISMQVFRDSFNQKSSEAMKNGGRFSNPPVIDDLRTLELDDNAIEQLRECEVGKCLQNMPAAMIKRFQTEIDWNAPDAKARATQLFREMLLEHVKSYVAGGHEALGAFDNGRKRIDLAELHRTLLDGAAPVNEFAPQFANYLREFPAGQLPNVDSSLHWSILDFGLKPSITVSHAAAYTEATGGSEQLLMASRQIYASRYLDSSLTLTMLLRVAEGNQIDTYLVLLDRTRSDSLDGAIGKMAKGIVQRKAADRIKTVLDKAHIRLLAAARPSGISTSDTRGSWMTRLVRRKSFYFVIASSLVVAMLYVLWRWRRKRTVLAPQSKIAA